MKVRSKCPLRLGIAGGGTDVSPYCDVHNGAILNGTINLYAYTFLETVDDHLSQFIADDICKNDLVNTNEEIAIDGPLMLHRAVYKRVMDQFNGGQYIPVKVMTWCDALPGSGLGSSSAVVVSMLEAYRELLSLPLGSMIWHVLHMKLSDLIVSSLEENKINMRQLLAVLILWNLVVMTKL